MQVDGSYHEWVRGERWTLLTFIDDATSGVFEARFVPSESSDSYFQVLEAYLRKQGLSDVIYSDCHTVLFAPRRKDGSSGLSQAGRALQELGISHLAASTARGRVELSHALAQDRLAIWNPRGLRNGQRIVNQMAWGRHEPRNENGAANQFLQHWLKQRNARFTVPPASPKDIPSLYV